MNLGAIVPVAGQSSRMGSFKPLMPLNGFPMVQMTVQSALDGGASLVCAVLGRNAADVRSALEPLDGVCFAHNQLFDRTDMLQSVKLGLRQLLLQQPQLDAFFLLPGDMPAVLPQTFSQVERAFASDGANAVIPRFEGHGAHPPLIGRTCFDAILNFEGNGGLAAVLHDFDVAHVDVDDPGSRMDADVKSDFEALERRARAVKGASMELCVQLWDQAGTPNNVRQHCMATARVCRRMAQHLNACGYRLDVELCTSGALLHDICRVQKTHSRKGARFLRALGYEALADIVLEHDGFIGICPRDFSEMSLVCYADKLAQNDQIVSIEQRYARGIEACGPDTFKGQMLRLDVDILNRMKRRYERLTGDVIV